MDNIMVSVCCQVFNHENYIRDALEGFVKQKTNFKYEVIIYDDASTDNSRAIIKDYVEKYPNLFVLIFPEENQWSKGVKIFEKFILPLVKGKYIAMCDGDDYWICSDKLQKQYEFLEQNNEYVACVHNNYISNVVNNSQSIMYKQIGDRDLELCNVVKGGSSEYQFASLMYRKEIQNDYPNFLYSMGAVCDYPLSVYLSILGRIRFMDEVMSVYRFNRPGSWTADNSSNFKSMAETSKDASIMLEMADKYSEGKYSDVFAPIILQNEFYGKLYSGDYSIFNDKSYCPILSKISFVRIVKLKKRCLLIKYFPSIYAKIKS